MTNRNTILTELKELGSILSEHIPQNPYQVPDGYFEGLANQVMNRIRALEAKNSSEETEFLSPLLNQADRKTPYTVPAGYFDGLEEKMMQAIRGHADYQTSDEELISLSPLIRSIPKTLLYSVPAGYFEKLGSEVTGKTEAKVISIKSRKWYHYAAAAVFIGVLFTGIVILLTQRNIDPNNNPHAWVEKKMKKVDIEEISNFVKLADADMNSKESIIPENKSMEVKELMKDVSDSEIQQFLNDTDYPDEADGEIMMN